MKKFFRIVILAITFLFSMGIFFACNSTQEPSENESSLTLDQTVLVLNVNETFTLTATKKNIDSEVIWLSSDEKMVTVTNMGKVMGRSEGIATISAMADGIFATCQVIVVSNGDLPRLTFNDVNDTIKVGESFEIEPVLKYDNKTINAKFTFASENEEVLEVSNKGKVTGKGVGKTKINVSTSIYGYVTTSFIEITVKPKIIITSSITDVLLGTSEINDYVTSAQVDLSVVLNDILLENPMLKWQTGDASVATVSEGLIKAVGVGSTTIDVIFTSYGDEYVYSIPVTVEKPIVESEYKFDVVDSNADNSETIAFNFDDGIDSAFKTSNVVKVKDLANQTEIPFTVSGDDILIKKTDVTIGEKSFALEWENVSYKVNFVLASKVIKTADEFANMYDYLTLANGKPGEAGSFYDGYFVLGADIDATGIDMKFGNWGSGGWFDSFSGVLDGQNHVVYNLDETNSNGGIFASTTESAIIRNLRFYNATMSGNGGFLVTGFAGKLENIFISGKILGGGANWAVTSLLVCKGTGTATFNNIAVVLEDNTLSDDKYASILYGDGGNLEFENTITLQLAGTPTPNYNVGRVDLTNAKNYESETLKAFTSADDYFAWIAGEGADAKWADFAKTEIENCIKAYITLKDAESGIIVGESAIVTCLNTAWLEQSKLLEDINGINYVYDAETQQGIITVAQSVAAGTKFTIQNTAINGIQVEKSFVTFERTSYTLDDIGDVDINDGNSTFTVNLHGFARNGVSDVLFNDVSLPSGAWSEKNGNVVITKSKIKDLFGEGILTVISQPKDSLDDDKKITISANVTFVTKIINNVNDLNNMKQYSPYTRSHTWELWGSNFTEDEWTGYYVLGSDIDLGSAEVLSKNNHVGGRIWEEGKAGFYGTFDGRGHYIKGGVYGVGGILGHGNKDAVVKNVAFIDVTLGEHSWSNVIAVSFWGELKNVFVTIKTDNRKDGEGGALIINGAAVFVANNVIVYDDGGKTLETAGRLSSYVNHQGYGEGENVYVFTPYYSAQQKYEKQCPIDPIPIDYTLSDANVDISAFDPTIWDMSGDRAKFVSMN